MSALLTQQAVETLSTDGGTGTRLVQQAVEVLSADVGITSGRLQQFAIEVANAVSPAAQLQHAAVEVLTSSSNLVVEPATGVLAFEPTDEVVERYSWATDVLIAKSGAQTRHSLRSSPRVQVEFDVVATGIKQSVALDALLAGWQSDVLLVPVWQDRYSISAAIAPGATIIVVPNTGQAYADGGMALLWTSPTEYEILNILTHSNSALTLSAPTVKAWGVGAWLAPLRRCWMQPQATAARFTGSNLTARLVLDAIDPQAVQAREWDESVEVWRDTLPYPNTAAALSVWIEFDANNNVEWALAPHPDGGGPSLRATNPISGAVNSTLTATVYGLTPGATYVFHRDLFGRGAVSVAQNQRVVDFDPQTLVADASGRVFPSVFVAGAGFVGSFTFWYDNLYLTTTGGPWVIDGFALFSRRPNWSAEPQVDYNRRQRMFGDGTTKPWRDDPSDRSWTRRQELHSAAIRPEVNQLLAWAAMRRGRAVSYLAPIWDATVKAAIPNAAGDLALTISGVGLSRVFSLLDGRGYLALRYKTGWIVRKISSIVVDSATEDILAVTASIGRAGTPDDWLDILICEPAILSSDTIEVRWWSDRSADIAIVHEQVIA